MKRICSILLTLCLVVFLFAINVSAWDEGSGIEVYWDDEYVGFVTYDEMKDTLEESDSITYSVVPKDKEQSYITTAVFTFDQLMDKVGKAEEWANTSSESRVKFTSVYHSKLMEFEKTKALYTEPRYYYPEDGSSEIKVPFGFYLSSEDEFRTILGQTSKSESNRNYFWELGNENTQVYIDTTIQSSNTWITFPDSVRYITSDETTDYYKMDVPAEQMADFNNQSRFVVRYKVVGLSYASFAKLQNPDGSTIPDGVSYSDPGGSLNRSVTIIGAERGSDYRLFWDASESYGQLVKNVVLDFSTPKELTFNISEDILNVDSYPTLTVENGLEGYEYDFKVNNLKTDAWWTIQARSPNNSCYWYAGPGPGDKNIIVTVYDVNGNVVKTFWEKVTVNPRDSDTDLTLNNFTSSVPVKELTASSNTELRVDASGGVAPYSYRFRAYNQSTKVWYTIQEFKKDANCCTWWAGPAAGNKTIYVEVKDAKNDTFMMVIPVKVKESPLKIDSLTISPESLTKNTTASLTATTSGAEGDVQYKFVAYNKDTNVWWTIQDFSTSNTCKWWTGPAAGNKAVYVYVKDDAGNTSLYNMDVTVEE